MPITSLPGANPHFPSTKLGFLCAFASKFFPMVVLRGSLQGTKEAGHKKKRAQRKLCTEESVLETGIEPVRTFLPTGF